MENKVCGGKRTKGIKKESLSGKPLITVATVVFNNKALLEETIKSVLSQTYDNVEYIIVDGGSTDGTLEIIKKYESQLDYWVSERDRGVYDGMNKAVSLASGEWVHLLNSDDCYASSDVLSRVVPNLVNDNKDFYYGMLAYQISDSKTEMQRFSYNWLRYYALFYSAYIPHPSLFVSKKQYKSIGEYDIKYRIAADHDLILRLCKRFTPHLLDFPITIMRAGGLSGMNPERTFGEFKDVTIAHGLPSILASLIYYFKIFKYKVL